jgi:hypothetical protein
MVKYLTAAVLIGFIFVPINSFAQKPIIGNTPSQVKGLELPNEVFSDSNQAFTVVQAKSEGTVKWLVVSDKPVQYIEDPDKKSIILGNLPAGANVNIFAVAVVQGNLTDFAGTKIVEKKSAIHKKETEAEPLNYKIRWH